MTHLSKQARGVQAASWIEEDGCGVIFSRDEESDDEYLLICVTLRSRTTEDHTSRR